MAPSLSKVALGLGLWLLSGAAAAEGDEQVAPTLAAPVQVEPAVAPLVNELEAAALEEARRAARAEGPVRDLVEFLKTDEDLNVVLEATDVKYRMEIALSAEATEEEIQPAQTWLKAWSDTSLIAAAGQPLSWQEEHFPALTALIEELVKSGGTAAQVAAGTKTRNAGLKAAMERALENKDIASAGLALGHQRESAPELASSFADFEATLSSLVLQAFAQEDRMKLRDAVAIGHLFNLDAEEFEQARRKSELMQATYDVLEAVAHEEEESSLVAQYIQAKHLNISTDPQVADKINELKQRVSARLTDEASRSEAQIEGDINIARNLDIPEEDLAITNGKKAMEEKVKLRIATLKAASVDKPGAVKVLDDLEDCSKNSLLSPDLRKVAHDALITKANEALLSTKLAKLDKTQVLVSVAQKPDIADEEILKKEASDLVTAALADVEVAIERVDVELLSPSVDKAKLIKDLAEQLEVAPAQFGEKLSVAMQMLELERRRKDIVQLLDSLYQEGTGLYRFEEVLAEMGPELLEEVLQKYLLRKEERERKVASSKEKLLKALTLARAANAASASTTAAASTASDSTSGGRRLSGADDAGDGARLPLLENLRALRDEIVAECGDCTNPEMEELTEIKKLIKDLEEEIAR